MIRTKESQSQNMGKPWGNPELERKLEGVVAL